MTAIAANHQNQHDALASIYKTTFEKLNSGNLFHPMLHVLLALDPLPINVLLPLSLPTAASGTSHITFTGADPKTNHLVPLSTRSEMR